MIERKVGHVNGLTHSGGREWRVPADYRLTPDLTTLLFHPVRYRLTAGVHQKLNSAVFPCRVRFVKKSVCEPAVPLTEIKLFIAASQGGVKSLWMLLLFYRLCGRVT